MRQWGVGGGIGHGDDGVVDAEFGELGTPLNAALDTLAVGYPQVQRFSPASRTAA